MTDKPPPVLLTLLSDYVNLQSTIISNSFVFFGRNILNTQLVTFNTSLLSVTQSSTAFNSSLRVSFNLSVEAINTHTLESSAYIAI